MHSFFSNMFTCVFALSYRILGEYHSYGGSRVYTLGWHPLCADLIIQEFLTDQKRYKVNPSVNVSSFRQWWTI